MRIGLTRQSIASQADIDTALDNLETLTDHGRLFGGVIRYVDGTNGDDGNDGLSPENPMATIAAALAASAVGDAVNVKAGTYDEAGLDVNLRGLELWLESGTILQDSADGTVLTVSGLGAVVRGEGNVRLDPTGGATGVVVSGNLCELENLRVNGNSVGALGYDITGDGAELHFCRCADRADCEGSAFAQANGVVLDKEETMHDKEQIDSAEELPLTPEQEPEAEQEQAPPEDAPEPAPPEDIPAEEPAAEMDSFGQIKDLLQSALDIIAQMMPGDDGSEMPEEPPMETAELFTESAVLELVEAEPPANRRAPLALDVGIIKVGPGNKRDNHYYTRAMLERDGGVFTGAKMYATDHRNDEKSVRTEVSLVKEVRGVQEFADGAYLTGRVTVFNPDFAEDVRNRADAGVLDSLHCSILAKGEAQPGEVDGDEYNVVTRITEAQSVDWVTRAGAGGHAMAIAESAAEPEEEEEAATETEIETQELDVGDSKPVTLSEDAELTPEVAENPAEEVIQSLPLAEVIAALGKTNLPASSVAELASGTYHELSEVEQAVTTEVQRLKAAGSGAPLAIGTPPQPQQKSIREIQAEQQAVNRKWLR